MGGTLAFLTRGMSHLPYRMDALFTFYRGIHLLATRSMDDALRSFEGVLTDKPTNLVALLGKVGVSLSVYPYISQATYTGSHSVCQTKLFASFKVVSTGASTEPVLYT